MPCVGRTKLPRRIATGVLFALGFFSAALLALDLPTRMLGVSVNVIAAIVVALVMLALARVVWDLEHEIRDLRSLTGADAQRKARDLAFGEVIATNQALDKEICAFRGSDPEQSKDEFARRLNEWHAMAEQVMSQHAPERIGYYRSNAGLLTTVGMIGWRDQYVSELRRRMLRLNGIQTER